MLVNANTTSYGMKLSPLSLALTFLGAAACGAQDPPAAPAVDPNPALRRALQQAGPQVALTIYPVRVLGRASADVADALGLVLERLGMPALEVAERAFAAGDAPWAAIPDAFATHVKTAPAPPPGYSLYAEYLGDPRRGPTEVRFVLVDRSGVVVLTDQQTPADAAWKRTAGRDPDPLGCSALVGERLFALAGWKKTPAVRDGKFAERWRNKSGVPDKAELAAIAARGEVLRKNLAKARIAVLPTLTAAGPDAESATRLAQALGRELGCVASALQDHGALAVKPSSNQQKRLWDLAKGLTAAVTQQPVDADYVLVADVGVRAGGGSGFTNIALCTRQGEVVLTDFQNDQHPMFTEVAPKDAADAERVVVARLVHLLR